MARAYYFICLFVLMFVVSDAFCAEMEEASNSFDPTYRSLQALSRVSDTVNDIENISLAMIYFGEKDKFAIINNNVYRKDDLYGLYVVSKIEKNRVLMVRSKKTYIVNLVKPLAVADENKGKI